MALLIVLNRRPGDGTDVAWNAARIANKAQEMGMPTRVFLMNDGVWIAHGDLAAAGDEAHGFLREALGRGAELRACGTCLDRAGIPHDKIIPEAQVSTLPDLVRWIAGSDRILTF
ncbi:MAG: DsrE family protein [bacterium]|jgi:uncharacterized protein involved in oxidation of intracellular sulfur